jgi:phosphoribosyl 1,2-cyclic phosphate phosphodiesterase
MPRNSLTILGCGTSTGVPVITCRCPVCRSRHPRNKRLRASAWFQVGNKSLLVDTSVDLRQQALRHGISKVDAVLFTHPHADHTHGIDEIRAFNFNQKSSIPAYGNDWTCTELREKFPYIFAPGPVEGGGIPQIDLRQFDPQAASLEIFGISVIPISLHHGSKESVGYRIDSVAYVTDCSYIEPQSLDRLTGLSVLVLDCLRLQPHGTHFNLDQALETVARLKPKKTFLTHLGHDFDYTKWTGRKNTKKLPKGVSLAYDGLIIQF